MRASMTAFLLGDALWPLMARVAATSLFWARAQVRGTSMTDGRRMGKSDLFAHFSEKFDMKRAQVREFFDELQQLSEAELKRSGEFVLPGMVKLVKQERQARMGRNPATGQQIHIAAKTVVKARIAKALKDAVLPG